MSLKRNKIIYFGIVVWISIHIGFYTVENTHAQNQDNATLKGTINIETKPDTARIRILNIKPKFYQGMELEEGKYHIEVSADGYETKKLWVSLIAGQDKKVDIQLNKRPSNKELKVGKSNTWVISSNHSRWPVVEVKGKTKVTVSCGCKKNKDYTLSCISTLHIPLELEKGWTFDMKQLCSTLIDQECCVGYEMKLMNEGPGKLYSR